MLREKLNVFSGHPCTGVAMIFSALRSLCNSCAPWMCRTPQANWPTRYRMNPGLSRCCPDEDPGCCRQRCRHEAMLPPGQYSCSQRMHPETKSDNFSTNRCSEMGSLVRADFSYCSKNNPEFLTQDNLKNKPMYLGNDDLPASNDSQNMHSPKIKKEKVQAIAS